MNRTKIAVVGTFDSKGPELKFLCDEISKIGFLPFSIDVGVNVPAVQADFRIADAYPYAFGYTKSDCIEANTRHASEMIRKMIVDSEIGGIISIGGGQGTGIANGIFRDLPIGFPKFLLSTIANLEGSIAQFKGVKDLAVMNSIVDIAGMNVILKSELSAAAAAICGMVEYHREMFCDRPVVGITCWGVITPCVEMVRAKLEGEGYEVLVFHANGAGGEMLEALIKEGKISAVADIALPEITMPLAGSDHAVIPDRLENAVKLGIPLVVVPGGADMVHVLKPQKMPKSFEGRKKYWHTKEVLFVRSTAEDSRAFAQCISEKLQKAGEYTELILPLEGTSMEAVAGAPLCDPEADRALFEALHKGLDDRIPVIDVKRNINNEEFADIVAKELIKLINKKRQGE